MRLAIDPGNDTGWALFQNDGTLVSCGVGTPPVPEKGLRNDVVWSVIIERPKIYSARLMKGDPNDIVTLAIGVGKYEERYEAAGARVGMAFPSEWKGQVPKDIHNARVYGALSASEAPIVDRCGKGIPLKKVHNMIDAIGLGKWAFLWKRWT